MPSRSPARSELHARTLRRQGSGSVRSGRPSEKRFASCTVHATVALLPGEEDFGSCGRGTGVRHAGRRARARGALETVAPARRASSSRNLRPAFAISDCRAAQTRFDGLRFVVTRTVGRDRFMREIRRSSRTPRNGSRYNRLLVAFYVTPMPLSLSAFVIAYRSAFTPVYPDTKGIPRCGST